MTHATTPLPSSNHIHSGSAGSAAYGQREQGGDERDQLPCVRAAQGRQGRHAVRAVIDAQNGPRA